MIVVRVQFPVNVSNKEDFIKKMAATTPKYEGLDGLTRKYYVMNDEGKQAGGIYLWETREHAEAWYNDPAYLPYIKLRNELATGGLAILDGI